MITKHIKITLMVFALSLLIHQKAYAETITANAVTWSDGWSSGAATVGNISLYGGYQGINSPGTIDWTFNSATAGLGSLSAQIAGYTTLDGLITDPAWAAYSDIFSIYVNNVNVFEGYFNLNSTGTDSITYNPTNATWTTNPGYFGYGGSGTLDISNLMVNLIAGDNGIRFQYDSPIFQAYWDESWQLNSATIETNTVPEPATLSLLFLGLTTLAFMSRNRVAAGCIVPLYDAAES